MNGVMMPSVSAGSSQREARVMCTPHVRVPSGAALTGLTAPSVTAMTSTEGKARQYGTVMTSPSRAQGGHCRRDIWLRPILLRRPPDSQDTRRPRGQHEGDHDGERTEDRRYFLSERMYWTSAQRSFSGRCFHAGMGPRQVEIFQKISPSPSS